MSLMLWTSHWIGFHSHSICGIFAESALFRSFGSLQGSWIRSTWLRFLCSWRSFLQDYRNGQHGQSSFSWDSTVFISPLFICFLLNQCNNAKTLFFSPPILIRVIPTLSSLFHNPPIRSLRGVDAKRTSESSCWFGFRKRWTHSCSCLQRYNLVITTSEHS